MGACSSRIRRFKGRVRVPIGLTWNEVLDNPVVGVGNGSENSDRIDMVGGVLESALNVSFQEYRRDDIVRKCEGIIESALDVVRYFD